MSPPPRPADGGSVLLPPGPLISAATLAPLLGAVRLLDARSGPQGQRLYRESHLVGAVHADLDRDLAAPAPRPEEGGRHPLPPLSSWAATLSRWSIGPGTPVVLYDDQGGANAAARGWWMLRAVGHRAVAVLDGGWQAALEEGLAVEADLPGWTEAPPYPVPDRWLLPVVSADQVETLRQDPSRVLIDTRAAERYRGEREPIDPVAGHIPGAINLPFSDNLGAQGRFLPPGELAARYRQALAGTPTDRAAVYCGSGVTACHDLLALEVAGLPGAALYVGSWGEWCRSPERPRHPPR